MLVLMLYLIYECSKGRKDLVFVSSSREIAYANASSWSSLCAPWSYRVYEIIEDSNPFYVDKITPLRVYRKGLPF